MKSIRQRSRSVHQRLNVSLPTSKVKVLVENNCGIDNLEFAQCLPFWLFGNRSFRQRVSSPTTSSTSVRQRLYLSSPASKLKLLFENNCQIDNLQVFYVCGQAILVWSAVELSDELDLLWLLLETLSIFDFKLAGWLPGDEFAFQFQH